MYISLLNLLACPVCKSTLSLLAHQESTRPTRMRLPAPQRYIEDGVLICTGCPRWYPLRGGIPELLPDHLRDQAEDRAWLLERRESFAGQEALFERLTAQESLPAEVADEGAHYKQAEMTVTRRNLPEGFFGPAMVAPFIPMLPEYSLDILLRFATTVQLLGVGVNALVLDLGVGYAWTTEWLVRLGYRAVGIDICRDYLLAGLPRMGEYMPHLIVGDVENLPLMPGVFDSVLSFDSFHHIPNRNRALAEIDRVMQPGATIAFVEPGKKHEHHPQSIAVMKQHGILEVGFDRHDLKNYVSGTQLGHVKHIRTDAHPHDMHTVKKAGAYRVTSLTPRKLYAGIVLRPEQVDAQAGEEIPIDVTLTNAGNTIWLGEGAQGEVRLGAHLYDANRSLLQGDYLEILLPHDVTPGEVIEMHCTIPAPAEPGEYIVEFDPLVVGLLWFKNDTYNVKDLPLRVHGSAAIDKKVIAPSVITPLSWKFVKKIEEKNEEKNIKDVISYFPSLTRAALQVWRSKGALALARKGWEYLCDRIAK